MTTKRPYADFRIEAYRGHSPGSAGNPHVPTSQPPVDSAVVGVRVDDFRGVDRLNMTSAVLQRARLADPGAGVWEAADLQWWWRRPRATDELLLPVWVDDVGPCAAIALTDWGASWQADALVVPHTISLNVIWAALLKAIDRCEAPRVEVLAREDDRELLSLLLASGFAANELEASTARSGITWMDGADRPAASPVPSGFSMLDRASRSDRPHPMSARSGDDVEARLQQCSLYDPELDLAIDSPEGDVAGYAMFWMDAVTEVGLLEPMRVEEAYQRQGLGRALVTTGLDRLARKGARRFKVGFSNHAALSLYVGAGFAVTAQTRGFRR